MKVIKEYFFCSPRLLMNISEIKEIDQCIENVNWMEEFSIVVNGKRYENQTGYNKALEVEFKRAYKVKFSKFI